MKVFVDTGALIALEVRKDFLHSQAKQYFALLKKKRAQFFTNDYVLVEAYTRLIYDLHLKAAKQFHDNTLRLLEKKQLALLEVEPHHREKVWEELESYSDHKLSFTDGTIIVHFHEYHFDEIFTFDKHFRDINLPTN